MSKLSGKLYCSVSEIDITTQAVSPVIKTCGNHDANIVGCTWLEAAVLCVLLCACTAVCVFIGSITIYGHTRTCLMFVNTQSAVGGYYSDVKSPWCVYMKMDTYVPIIYSWPGAMDACSATKLTTK